MEILFWTQTWITVNVVWSHSCRIATNAFAAFESFAPSSAEFNMYSRSELRKSVVTSVKMELAELPEEHSLD